MTQFHLNHNQKEYYLKSFKNVNSIYCEDEIFYFYQKINITNNNIQGDNNKNNYNKSSTLNNSQDDLKKIKKEDLRDNIKENLNNKNN